ncbi:MAG: mandelate racemase/muconate lactonizing enzyme family protein [Parvibaculaceae bacterium]
MTISPIVEYELIPLRVPQDRGDECDGTAEIAILRLIDADGRVGVGEINGPTGAASAFIQSPSFLIWARGMMEMVVGADPLERVALWDKLYEGTLYTARRGAGIAALSGVDIALHDLAGKRLGVPVYKLLGGARQPYVTPYATIFPGMPKGRSIRQLMDEIGDLFDRARKLGFTAVKMEVMFEDLADDDMLVSLIGEGRQRLGKETKLAIDFAYRWQDWRSAARVLDRIAEFDILFAEATLMHDDIPGHAKLARVSPIRVCGAELASTRWEVREWIQQGQVDVVQPAITRAGGFTEMLRIAEMCNLSGVQCIPHGWIGGIGSMCQLHMQAACVSMPYVEYLHPELFHSPIRSDVTTPHPALIGGHFPLPVAPGLGVELVPDAISQFKLAA